MSISELILQNCKTASCVVGKSSWIKKARFSAQPRNPFHIVIGLAFSDLLDNIYASNSRPRGAFYFAHADRDAQIAGRKQIFFDGRLEGKLKAKNEKSGFSSEVLNLRRTLEQKPDFA